MGAIFLRRVVRIFQASCYLQIRQIVYNHKMLNPLGKFLIFSCLVGLMTVAAFSQSDPGQYFAGYRTVTVTRPNATTFTARLYYPAFYAGQDTIFDSSGCPCPAITFGHGFFQAVSTYQSTLEHLATHGYLVIASNSESGLFPNHQNFANDLRHSLTFLEQENANAASFLFGAVAVTRFGASGHSMGGGASILATAQDTRIRALANLAAAETNPSAKAAMPSITVPVSLLSGSADTIVPVATNGQEMYSLGQPPKLLLVIQGGWHCGFQDSNGFGCDTGTIPRSLQLQETRNLLTSFFDLYLKQQALSILSVWASDFESPFVQTQRNAGVSISPEVQTINPMSKGKLLATVTVTNLTNTAQTFHIGAIQLSAPFRIKPFDTPVIAAGAEYPVTINLRRVSKEPQMLNTILFSVTGAADPLTASFARINVNEPIAR